MSQQWSISKQLTCQCCFHKAKIKFFSDWLDLQFWFFFPHQKEKICIRKSKLNPLKSSFISQKGKIKYSSCPLHFRGKTHFRWPQNNLHFHHSHLLQLILEDKTTLHPNLAVPVHFYLALWHNFICQLRHLRHSSAKRKTRRTFGLWGKPCLH